MQATPIATPEADQLAAAMRRLGEDPRDVQALLTAGELSLRLGDAGGAASLFKRAEAIEPMNGRVRAGMARILVTQERPGEALRYFDQAIGFGLDSRTFAGDRGLAYDLIGEQERAQRDYRLALKTQDNDEVRRRYALSLGISGKREQALAQIEPLLRRNDRGAWRARAFILAMTGDVPGANAIATGMMPPNMAQGLAPFFSRLPSITAADRAFAVHFGEVRPTPERLADARLVPPLPQLGPDPDRAVAAVQAPVVAATAESGRDRRRRLARERREERARVALARAEARAASRRGASRPARVQTATAPMPPRSSAAAPRPGFGPALQPLALAQATRAARPRPQPSAPDRTTVAAPAPAAAMPPAPAPAPAPPPAQLADAAPSSPGRTATAVAPPSPVAAPTAPAAVASVSTAPAPSPAAMPSAGMVAGPAPTTVQQAQADVAPANVAPAAAPVAAAAVAPTPPAVPPQAVAATTPVAPRMSEDSILARIVAGIAIPGYELGVGSPPTPPAPPAPVPSPVPVEVAQAAPAAPAPSAPTLPAPAPKPRTQVATAKPAPVEKAKADITEKAKPGKAVVVVESDKAKPKGKRDAEIAKADPKSKREAETAKLDPKAKPDPKKAKPGEKSANADKKTKPEPKDEPRIWVQVAGGAFAGDLPKAWAAAKSKAPALAKRDGYATPLRATNRVVTGPFKTEAEAQALVNQLSKQGMSAFTFKSAAGQKVTRLSGK